MSFAVQKAEPTEADITDFLNDQVSGYFAIPGLLDPELNMEKKSAPAKKQASFLEVGSVPLLTPPQRAVQDYGGVWYVDDGVMIYRWKTVEMTFSMVTKQFTVKEKHGS